MKPKSDKDIADEIDARNRLRRNGYTQEPCKICEGMCQRGYDGMEGCPTCGGKGYTWRGPLMC